MMLVLKNYKLLKNMLIINSYQLSFYFIHIKGQFYWNLIKPNNILVYRIIVYFCFATVKNNPLCNVLEMEISSVFFSF